MPIGDDDYKRMIMQTVSLEEYARKRLRGRVVEVSYLLPKDYLLKSIPHGNYALLYRVAIKGQDWNVAETKEPGKWWIRITPEAWQRYCEAAADERSG